MIGLVFLAVEFSMFTYIQCSNFTYKHTHTQKNTEVYTCLYIYCKLEIWHLHQVWKSWFYVLLKFSSGYLPSCFKENLTLHGEKKKKRIPKNIKVKLIH